MIPEQEAAIRERHHEGTIPASLADMADELAGWCYDCQCAWPCDTAKVLAALDEYREAGVTGPGTLLDGYGRLKVERDAARADADRLADKASMWHTWCIGEGQHSCVPGCTTAAALKAHEVLKP